MITRCRGYETGRAVSGPIVMFQCARGAVYSSAVGGVAGWSSAVGGNRLPAPSGEVVSFVSAAVGAFRSPDSRESFAASRDEITVRARQAAMKPAPKNHVSFATGDAGGRPPVPLPPPPPMPKPPPSERCKRTVTIMQSAKMSRITRMIFDICAVLYRKACDPREAVWAGE